jgi:hypothetical protein
VGVRMTTRFQVSTKTNGEKIWKHLVMQPALKGWVLTQLSCIPVHSSAGRLEPTRAPHWKDGIEWRQEYRDQCQQELLMLPESPKFLVFRGSQGFRSVSARLTWGRWWDFPLRSGLWEKVLLQTKTENSLPKEGKKLFFGAF